LSEVADLNKHKTKLKAEYSGYIASHREIKTVLNGFMTAALLEKPDNVFEFARAHFAGLQAEFCPQDAGTLVPLVLTGPPGVGKKSLVKRLQQVCPGQFVDPLRHTARPPVAEFEKDGEDAHFVSVERLEADIENGRLFHYGTDETGLLEGISFESVDDVIAAGKVPVLPLSIDSYLRLVRSRRYPELRSVLVRPHEVSVLAERLLERGKDSKDQITRALARADEDMVWAKGQIEAGRFSVVIVNAVLAAALGELKVAAQGWYPHVERHMVHHEPR